MKHLILIALILYGCQTKAQYHIRVECYGKSDDWKYQDYYVRYTNDNWVTSFELKEAFDISSPTYPNGVCFNPKLFTNMYTSKQDAIDFARQFTSFKMCEHYNKDKLNKYKQLLAYRKAHPMKFKSEDVVKNRACCKIIKVY